MEEAIADVLLWLYYSFLKLLTTLVLTSSPRTRKDCEPSVGTDAPIVYCVPSETSDGADFCKE